MTVLSNRTIIRLVMKGHLRIAPFILGHVQPAGYDLTLAEGLVLWPDQAKLACSAEHIWVPKDLVGTLHGRSSLARQFVMTHCVSGPLEPGWNGEITFELKNLGNVKQVYHAGDRLAQVRWDWLDQPADPGYQGRYQGQVGITKSRFEHGDD